MQPVRRGLGALAGVLVRNYHLLIVTLAFVGVAVLAGISGYWLFYRAAYILGGLIPLCFLWARSQARGLEVTIDRATDRLQVGQEAEAKVHLRSLSMWTKLALELEDQTDMPGPAPKIVITLPARGVRNWKVEMPCRRRGVYTVGPLRVTAGDPFGLFRFSREYGEKKSVLVLPQAEELPYFWAPAAQLPGEGVVRRRTHYVTPNAAGIRDYYPGDSFNRIHWKSTSRLGRLMVKTFEMDPTSHIWLVLDLHGAAQAGSGDESTEEYGVRIATSLAYRFLSSNRMVGLILHGDERAVLDPVRGMQQYGRILETLAVASARGPVPLAALLQEEARRFGRHTTAIIITPSADEEWVLSLQQLLQQGTRAAAVLLDAESFREASPADERTPRAAAVGVGEPAEKRTLPVQHLLAAGVLTYVVPARSDISLMLGPAGMAGMETAERTGRGEALGAPAGRQAGAAV